MAENFEGKKRIVFFQGDRSACSFYRGLAPLHAMTGGNTTGEYIYENTGIFDKKYVDFKYDIAVFQRQYRPEVFSPMMKMKQNGTKLIYEIDDNLFDVPKWNPAHKVFSNETVQGYIRAFLSNVDAIFVTQEYLADVYYDYNKNIYILPNSIDFKVLNQPRPRQSKKPVVCWQGSNTHEKDLALIRKSLHKLVQDGDAYIKLWSMDFPGAQKVNLVYFESFFTVFPLLDIDIGLAPIAPNKFNRCKSNLKFLEYSALKIPTIASNFGPYKETIKNGETGILVDSVDEWYKSVRFLLDHEEERIRLGENAYNYVKENFDIDKNCLLWKKAFDEISS